MSTFWVFIIVIILMSIAMYVLGVSTFGGMNSIAFVALSLLLLWIVQIVIALNIAIANPMKVLVLVGASVFYNFIIYTLFLNK